MATDRETLGSSVEAGWQALSRGAWNDARGHFEAALDEHETATALEGLGWVGWWTADQELTMRTRERAYRAYRAEGDPGGAARVAAWLAADYREYLGDPATGHGWFERAGRLLDDLPEGADHAWVALHRGSFALDEGLPAEAERLARFAHEIGRRESSADLEAVGLAQEGIALVAQGRLEEGMRRLDESSAMALSDDLEQPVSIAWALCYLISACDGVGDFARAERWCDAMREFGERWGSRQVLGVCRTSYGRVLATSGDWRGAENELMGAIGDIEAARPAMTGLTLARLAELRSRQGRTDEARELLERAGPHGMAVLGKGELALHEGDAASAADAADRVLRRMPDAGVLDRLPAIELLVRARAAQGDHAGAEEARQELLTGARELGTPYLVGRAHLVAAEVALARGDADEARRRAEDGTDCFAAAAAPYEAALARVMLADALARLGRADQAAAEATAARDVFASLGAVREVARADALLEPPAAGSGNGGAGLGDLTPRELEVLRLVAQGLSDASIAERLVVSPHTVHRHMANVRAKLRLPSRAAAVAYAARAGLL